MNFRLISLVLISLHLGVVFSVTRTLTFEVDCEMYNDGGQTTTTQVASTTLPITTDTLSTDLSVSTNLFISTDLFTNTTAAAGRKKRYSDYEWNKKHLIAVGSSDVYELYLILPNQTTTTDIDCGLRFQLSNQTSTSLSPSKTTKEYFTGLDYAIAYNELTSFTTIESCGLEIFLYSDAKLISYYSCESQIQSSGNEFTDHKTHYQTTDTDEWLGIRMRYTYTSGTNRIKGSDYKAKITIKTYEAVKLDKQTSWTIVIIVIVLIILVMIVSVVCKNVERVKRYMSNPTSILGGGGGTAIAGMAGGALAGGALAGALGGGNDNKQQNYAPPPYGAQPHAQGYHQSTRGYGQEGYPPPTGGYNQQGYQTSPGVGQQGYPPLSGGYEQQQYQAPPGVGPGYPPQTAYGGFGPPPPPAGFELRQAGGSSDVV